MGSARRYRVPGGDAKLPNWAWGVAVIGVLVALIGLAVGLAQGGALSAVLMGIGGLIIVAVALGGQLMRSSGRS